MNVRLAELRKELELSQNEFADRVGISSNYVWMLENGSRKASDKTLKSICRAFNVNIDWLKTGFGPHFLDANSDRETLVYEAIKKARPDMPDSFPRRIAEAMAKLDSDDWLFLARLAQDMAEKADAAKKSAPDESKADDEMVYSETVAKNEQRTPFAVRKGHDSELLEAAKTRVKKVPGSDLE